MKNGDDDNKHPAENKMRSKCQPNAKQEWRSYKFLPLKESPHWWLLSFYILIQSLQNFLLLYLGIIREGKGREISKAKLSQAAQAPHFQSQWTCPKPKETPGACRAETWPLASHSVSYTMSSPTPKLLLLTLYIQSPQGHTAGSTGVARYGCFWEQEGTSPPAGMQAQSMLPDFSREDWNTDSLRGTFQF